MHGPYLPCFIVNTGGRPAQHELHSENSLHFLNESNIRQGGVCDTITTAWNKTQKLVKIIVIAVSTAAIFSF